MLDSDIHGPDISTVNLEILAIIIFLQIALKTIFATLKNRDYVMVYLYQ